MNNKRNEEDDSFVRKVQIQRLRRESKLRQIRDLNYSPFRNSNSVLLGTLERRDTLLSIFKNVLNVEKNQFQS